MLRIGVGDKLPSQSVEELKVLLGVIDIPSEFSFFDATYNVQNACTHAAARAAGQGMCPTCLAYYRNALRSLSHYPACSPVPDFQGHLQAAYNRIKGLDYAKFGLDKTVLIASGTDHTSNCLE